MLKLNPLLPTKLQGESYEEAIKSQPIAQFFDLADMVLSTADSWNQHVNSLDMTGITKDNPIKTRLPHFDLDFLNLRCPSGQVHPPKIADVLSIIIAYWENPKDMAISIGYVTKAGFCSPGKVADFHPKQRYRVTANAQRACFQLRRNVIRNIPIIGGLFLRKKKP